jgi:two-component system response regulator MprA
VHPNSLELARVRERVLEQPPPVDGCLADPAREPACVPRGERPLELTRTEQRLLELLLRNPDQVLPRDMIYERVWGHDISATSNSLDVYVGYLRRKTEEAGEPRLIHTVRGVGFRLGG